MVGTWGFEGGERERLQVITENGFGYKNGSVREREREREKWVER
jgi:hypothetical protein